MHVVIRGVVTTTGHTHQTAPDSGGAQLTTNIATLAGWLRRIPYVSATSVRALIRRHAARRVCKQLLAAGMQITRGLYLSITRGATGRTQLASGGATYMQMVMAARHVFAGLFGGGAWLLRSGFRLESDLKPILVSTRHLLPASVQPFAIEAAPSDLIVNTPLAPRDDFARLPEDARNVVADVSQAYAEHMANKAVQSAGKKADANAKSDNLDNFVTVECMAPGVPLYFSGSAASANAAQAGLLLLAVQDWANANALGGGSARGMGAFVASLSLTVDGKLITDALLVGDAPYITLADHPTVAELVAACESVFPVEITPETLGEVYPSDIASKVDKKAGKTAKADQAAKDAQGNDASAPAVAG